MKLKEEEYEKRTGRIIKFLKLAKALKAKLEIGDKFIDELLNSLQGKEQE